MKTDIMTLPELCNYLKIKPITVYKHLAAGRLPGFKIGSGWRFRKSTIDAWISEMERYPLQTITCAASVPIEVWNKI